MNVALHTLRRRWRRRNRLCGDFLSLGAFPQQLHGDWGKVWGHMYRKSRLSTRSQSGPVQSCSKKKKESMAGSHRTVNRFFRFLIIHLNIQTSVLPSSLLFCLFSHSLSLFLSLCKEQTFLRIPCWNRASGARVVLFVVLIRFIDRLSAPLLFLLFSPFYSLFIRLSLRPCIIPRHSQEQETFNNRAPRSLGKLHSYTHTPLADRGTSYSKCFQFFSI